MGSAYPTPPARLSRAGDAEAEADADALYWARIPIDERAELVSACLCAQSGGAGLTSIVIDTQLQEALFDFQRTGVVVLVRKKIDLRGPIRVWRLCEGWT